MQLSWLLVASLALQAAQADVPAGHVVWLETEAFANYGGWTNDSQFIDQMGSPYLMAIGLGTPVADAVAAIMPPKPGRYRLWARTRDWAPQFHPGRFQIVLERRPVHHVFGESGKRGWQWEDGGVCRLTGRAEVRLHDLTGYYARCDAIVLCDDLSWTPPTEKQAIARLRERFGGVSREAEKLPEHDVVVIGGGLAGCMAAVSAARVGAKTILLQNRPVLGGNASVEILVPPVGVWPHKGLDPLDPRETGLIEEVRAEGNQKTDEAKLYSARLQRLVAAEPNLRTLLQTHATGVEKASPQTIRAVLAVNVRTGKRCCPTAWPTAPGASTTIRRRAFSTRGRRRTAPTSAAHSPSRSVRSTRKTSTTCSWPAAIFPPATWPWPIPG